MPGGFPGEPWQDGDGDEWNNEMECLFNTSPTDPRQRHPLQRVAAQSNVLDSIVLNYRRPAHWRDLGLWFQFEGGHFLDSYFASPLLVEEIGISSNAGLETVTVRITVPTSPYPTFFTSLRIRRD